MDPVHVPCLCDPKDGDVRHPAGDRVTLRERLDFPGAMAAKHAVTVLKSDDPDASAADVLAVLTEQYVIHGIESWTLVNSDGRPLPVTKPEIRQRVLTNDEAAYAIADAADDAYQQQVLLPLLAAASKSSPDTSTDDSTSPPTGSEPTPLTPSRPSWITTTPTDDTEATISAPAGDSSTSPRSTSAA